MSCPSPARHTQRHSHSDLVCYSSTPQSNPDIYRFMHIGLVQVAFKPLTLRGLPERFIAALHDGRNHNWKKSLIGTIQTSLAYGPVYFNAYPNLQISLQDENSLSSLMLNVNTEISEIEQLNDGTVKIRFHEPSNMIY
ncbi:hypothetical protein H5410_009885 [Solanum commersonii]|uniref:Uncharacterized protein n=1 Tax=Solanum commersonii TaxID=4109 RepID=A0A9J6AK15_SOLCO|nr:hypothetical protein H5410_009885 [Solanum commersonii]